MRDYDGRIETEDREITSSLVKRLKTIEDLNLLMKNRVLFFRENSIFRKLLFELQTVFEGFAHSFVYQIVAMCIWVECNGID